MMRFAFTVSFAALAVSQAFAITATKAYVDGATNATLTAAKLYTDQHGGGGGSGANVLHYTRSTASFSETPAEIARFATTNQPLFCAVDTNLWFSLANVVQQSVSGVETYTLTMTCDNASNSAGGIYKPWIMSVLCAPSANYVVAQIGQASVLAESFSALTNSAAFRNAVAAVGTTSGTVTKLWNAAEVQFLDGDLNLYAVYGTAWTNDVAYTYNGVNLPAGTLFSQVAVCGDDTPARWTATVGSDAWKLEAYDDGDDYIYNLYKNGDAAFPGYHQAAAKDDADVFFGVQSRGVTMCRFAASTPSTNLIDSVARYSTMTNKVKEVDSKIETRTATDWLKQRIGFAGTSDVGYAGYGLTTYNTDVSGGQYAISGNHWDNTLYPAVKLWASGEIAKSSPNHVLVLTNGAVKTKSGTAITAANVGAATSNEVESVKAIVQTWEGFLDGSNVVFSITNYISGSYNLDVAKLRILEMTNNVYREVYNSRGEIVMHLDNFKTNDFRIATNAVVTSVDAKIAAKADKAWGKYTSAGGEAPSNTVYMTAPNTVFAGGMEYERVAVGEGSVCVLTTKGAPTYTVGDEGTFKFQDEGGTNYFGFAKTDSYTIGANTDGISVASGIVTLTYNVTMTGVPCIWYTTNLTSSATWEQLNLPDGTPVSGASHVVSWEQSPPAGKEICYINCASEPEGFFKATIEVEGSAKFMTNMPADLGGGIICTNTATGVNGVIRPSYNGSAVQWTWSAQ